MSFCLYIIATACCQQQLRLRLGQAQIGLKQQAKTRGYRRKVASVTKLALAFD